ncbi:hypothetical protein BD626DRAFT_157067 [Schizophyllum amplum]|uniref:Uncharacterized protein n=1 Tax=Schizophyllum amplum TaxID=97359 RepID=A0A550C360_9AGAR|nr:hypothetical protein BD626DRAFT_157067 [Auriculariopsis ampla]
MIYVARPRVSRTLPLPCGTPLPCGLPSSTSRRSFVYSIFFNVFLAAGAAFIIIINSLLLPGELGLWPVKYTSSAITHLVPPSPCHFMIRTSLFVRLAYLPTYPLLRSLFVALLLAYVE